VVETVVGLGGAGGLLAAFGYLLMANRGDRRDYRQAVDQEEARAERAEQRVRDIRAKLEEQRTARYACEEAAAGLRAELAALRRDGGR
jgi:multidrug resistance efflux pump